MKQRIKVSILLLIFSISIISQTVQAATYYVDKPEDEIIQFNRAMAMNDRDITLECNAESGDYHSDIIDYKNALQDYAAVDYAYYSMHDVTMNTSTLDNGTKKIIYGYDINGLETPDQTKYVFDTIHSLEKAPNFRTASDYDKALWAYHYVVDHVTYYTLDDDIYTEFSAYGALHDGMAVCQGYALLYYALVTELGLTCKIVSGVADNGREKGGHAWNVLKLEGKWYYVDTTWGDGSGDMKYFLAPKNDLTSHTLDPMYENYFDFADQKYVNNGTSGYHGILPSVYNVKLDPLKIIKIDYGSTFSWLLDNPDQIKLTFTSADESVAKVDDKGIITGIGPGTTVIKVANQDLGIEQSCTVTVGEPKPVVTGYHNINVIYHKKAAVNLEVTPSGIALTNVAYESMNEKIACVDQKGNVIGMRAGKTSIVVTYGEDNLKVTIPVTVSPLVNSKYKAITVKVRKTASIKNAVTVSDYGYRDLIFRISDSRIAKVSSSGTVSGVKKGSCYINIYDKVTDKLTAKVKVTVK